jgi:hypothetical protein
MKRLLWLLVALGTVIVQVQPVRATLRMPAAAECCQKASACCEHPNAAPAKDDCSACLPCCTGCALLPALDFFTGSLAQPARVGPADEQGDQRRDPPPLPPPRWAPLGSVSELKT